MKKLTVLLVLFISFFSLREDVFAVENPLSVSNNKFGIHILFTEEINDAARLVNSSGGDWGYVTIPIQSGDRNITKWQKFMNDARSLHVVPIIRLATEGDYFNTKVWRKPKEEDVLDFANFLNSLYWPTKNRYIIIFNEPNRADEWGGVVNPSEYANLLNYAVSVFKSKSPDFFIISAGFDNASINSTNAMNEYDYMKLMNSAVPGIFAQVDGLGSHSYPNPGFSQSPKKQDSQSIATFRFEKNLISSFAQKDLPVFIAETGWINQSLSDDQIASYFAESYETVWSDNTIVAISPFLLRADSGPFTGFSLIKNNGDKTERYKKIESISKIKGSPLLNPIVLGEKTEKNINVPVKDFSGENDIKESLITVPPVLKLLFRKLIQN